MFGMIPALPVLPDGADCILRRLGEGLEDALVRLEGKVYSLSRAIDYLREEVGLTTLEASEYISSLPHVLV